MVILTTGFIFALVMLIVFSAIRPESSTDFFTQVGTIVVIVTAYLVVRQLDVAANQTELMKRQTTIIENQDALLNAKPSLKLIFVAQEALDVTEDHYVIRYWGSQSKTLRVGLQVYNSGKTVTDVTVELFVDSAAVKRLLIVTDEKTFGKWRRGIATTQPIRGVATELHRFYLGSPRTFYSNAHIDIEPINIRLQPQNDELPMYWRIHCPSGAFPSDATFGTMQLNVIGFIKDGGLKSV